MRLYHPAVQDGTGHGLRRHRRPAGHREALTSRARRSLPGPAARRPTSSCRGVLEEGRHEARGREAGDARKPAPAANAFVVGTGGLDAAVTYEPYLGLVRDKPESGKLIADLLQYPMVFDSFGCTLQVHQGEPQGRQSPGRELLPGARVAPEGQPVERRVSLQAMVRGPGLRDLARHEADPRDIRTLRQSQSRTYEQMSSRVSAGTF